MPDSRDMFIDDIFSDGQWEEEDTLKEVNSVDPDTMKKDAETVEKKAPYRPSVNIRLITPENESIQILKADDIFVKDDGGAITLAFKNDSSRILFDSRTLFSPQEIAALSESEMQAIGKAVAMSAGKMIKNELDPDRVTRKNLIDLSPKANVDYIGSLKKAYIEKCLQDKGQDRADRFLEAKEENERLARSLFSVLGTETVTNNYHASLLITTDKIGPDGRRGESLVPVLQLENVGQRIAAPVLGKVMQRYGLEWDYDRNSGVFSCWTRTPLSKRPILNDHRALKVPDHSEYDQILYTMAKIRAETENSNRSYPIAHGHERLSEDQIFNYASQFRSPENIMTYIIQDKEQNKVFAEAYLKGMGLSRLTSRGYEMEIAEAKTIASLYRQEIETGTTVVRLHGVSEREISKLSKELERGGLFYSYDNTSEILSVAAYNGPDRPLFEGNLTEPDYTKLKGSEFVELAAHSIGINQANSVIDYQTGMAHLSEKRDVFADLRDAECTIKKYEIEKSVPKQRERTRAERSAFHMLRETEKERLCNETVLHKATLVRDDRLMSQGYQTPPSLSKENMELIR